MYYNNFTAHLQQHLNAAQRNFRDANPAAKQCGNMRGNIRQINDYYPYGLTWSRPEGDDSRMYQNKQWQQNEWGEGNGLEMYDFHVQKLLAAVQRRLRDSHPAAQPCGTKMGVYPGEGRNPVLARWHAPDPMNQFDSPYNAMLRSSWSKQSEDLEIRIPQQCFAGGNNPVVNIDPDGMQVPWAGILSSLSRIQITETVKHCTNAARMTFENITVSKNLFGQLAGVMDVAGGLLAFGEGALILSEGQKELGAKASSNMDKPTYENNPNRGIQIHYGSGGKQTVSITNLSDDELKGALDASGQDPFVVDVVEALFYLRYADISHNKILLKLATSRRKVHLRKGNMDDKYAPRNRGKGEYSIKKGVYWDPKAAETWRDSNGKFHSQSPALGLYFEMGHAYMHHYRPFLYHFLSILPVRGYFRDLQEKFNLIHYESDVAFDLWEDVRTDQATDAMYIKDGGPLTIPKN